MACYPDSPFVIPAQAGIQWFNKPFPHSGNDNQRDYPTRHPASLPSLYLPASSPGFEPSLE